MKRLKVEKVLGEDFDYYVKKEKETSPKRVIVSVEKTQDQIIFTDSKDHLKIVASEGKLDWYIPDLVKWSIVGEYLILKDSLQRCSICYGNNITDWFKVPCNCDVRSLGDFLILTCDLELTRIFSKAEDSGWMRLSRESPYELINGILLAFPKRNSAIPSYFENSFRFIPANENMQWLPLELLAEIKVAIQKRESLDNYPDKRAWDCWGNFLMITESKVKIKASFELSAKSTGYTPVSDLPEGAKRYVLYGEIQGLMKKSGLVIFSEKPFMKFEVDKHLFVLVPLIQDKVAVY